jgi:UDP-3-O-[3-hydroxymyristoyl] N-acetylglucosamine deacetylase
MKLATDDTRPQRTLARPAQVSGFGLFSGADVTVRFLPAPEHHGVAFQRIDLPDQPRIPALIRYVQPGLRRTVLARGPAEVHTVEHVLAALAGLQVDNCLVQLTAGEPPNGDGSSDHFVAALLDAGFRDQSAPRHVHVIDRTEHVALPGGQGSITLGPANDGRLQITYDLDYPGTAVGRQSCTLTASPTAFVSLLSFARTFVFDPEVAGLRAQGLGLRATTRDLVVFGEHGPVDNALRADNECARHKALDCIGDFALLGCDLAGTIHCRQSGHALNHELVRRLSSRLRTSARLAAAG